MLLSSCQQSDKHIKAPYTRPLEALQINLFGECLQGSYLWLPRTKISFLHNWALSKGSFYA
jgi:hypothetical protein